MMITKESIEKLFHIFSKYLNIENFRDENEVKQGEGHLLTITKSNP